MVMATNFSGRHPSESWDPIDLALNFSKDFRIKVAPVRIRPFNQLNFPSPPPSLDRFLTKDRRLHGPVHLIPDQSMDLVFPGETFHLIVLVLPNSAGEVGSDTDV
jgi:hypothetical protein